LEFPKCNISTGEVILEILKYLALFKVGHDIFWLFGQIDQFSFDT